MAAPEKDPELRLLQKNPLDPNTCQKSRFLETEWKTAMLAVKSQGHLSRCPSVAESGDGGIGTSCSDSTEDFCNSSSSSSFHPIKTQVTIPTAHVMPSTLGASPSKLCPAGEQGSAKPAVPACAPEHPGLTRNGDFSTGKSQVPPRDLLHLCRAPGQNSCEHSWPPAADHRTEDAWKFDTPAIEQTLNQSLFLDSLCTDPLHRCQKFTPSSEAGKEHYKVLPESKQGVNGASEPRDGTWPRGSRLMPAGLQANNFYSKPVVAPPAQVWMQEGCTLHPHQGVCELSAWKQQLDKVRLQVEQMQLQNGGTCPHSSMYSPSLPAPDPAQWINILNSNENLLKEKELLIDRQRQYISQLEQKVRESELQVHSALLGCPASYGDVCMLRMQELQQENTFLRAQFTEKTESLSNEKVELERKLAAAEVDVKLLRESLKETVQKHAEELKKQEERVKGRDKHINNLKKKCQKESEQNKERQQRIETLERYLADLPTLEDHQKQSQKLKESELKATALQETVLALETELGDVQAAFREQELQLETQKHKEMELQSTVHSLQDKLQQYAKNAKRGPPAQDEERQNMEHDSLKKEFDCLKKIVDKRQKKMEQLSLLIKNLEERVAQEEGTSQALKEEGMRRETALRAAVKELSLQNQDLIEKNLTLQEQLQQAQLTAQPLPADTAHLAQELHGELAICLQDLQSVYSIVTQRAQGKDPNLSLLLGIHSVQYPVKEKDDLLSPDGLAKKLVEVKQLHKEVEELRTAISDRYAQDMGENCITQ
ncbi:centrosomal protein of 85 kDa isoform X1 [Oenanthe melanoleuca]|uniref:centrosomal protein of 85 kDa isoform X1 n=2 Tax=Oenanthe melanoleuca TaxID=2939378 RepID=UPI0024C1D1F3|nr:centrosomal protein of 85 kDa isoform X1 [Oenanthe melanoleuca]XP_056365224.1 centrosomal protein of 85 kDa isoform X1 [Oenanthe melanoleuca]XP_056365225.1 centrosomal protein of 85 kDa isoform X1 [Oenanthe melanoleuca]